MKREEESVYVCLCISVCVSVYVYVLRVFKEKKHNEVPSRPKRRVHDLLGLICLPGLEGYLSVRPLDVSALDLFVALRAATYVGWIISRMEESGAEARNIRFVATARELAKTYLTEKGAL